MGDPPLAAYFLTLFVSMFPIAELRGGIPLAVSLGLSPAEAYVVSVIGNLIPVLPLLLGLEYFSRIARRCSWSAKILDALERRVQSKQKIVHKYGVLGIIILVAIPLPVTGAWTGSFVSFLLSVPLKYSFLAICLGVLIAGVIVLYLTFGLFSIGRTISGM